MIKTTKLFALCIPLLLMTSVQAQQVKRLTLSEVIELAEEQSPSALMAKHRFRASYWRHRSYKAEFLPSLSLRADLADYNRTYNEQYVDGQYTFVERNTNTSALSLQLSQNIGLTGGRVFISSDLTRFDAFSGDGSTDYISSPISINFVQPLFGYNSLKWQNKTEPLRYERAKKEYLSDIVNVHNMAVNRFFDLATAQVRKEIAELNYSNSDTLYRIAQGRYNLGTIAEDELLQMELSWLNAGTARNEAYINLDDSELRMRSFLGFNENVRIELIIEDDVPEFEVDVDKVLELAMENNPFILDQELTLLEAASQVEQARANRGITGSNLTVSYGMRQRDESLADAYRNPDIQQRIRVGLTIPILDWGLSKGRLRMAESNQEVTRVRSEQMMTDFIQGIMLDVHRFNLQPGQVRIAATSDEIATRRYEVTRQRFLIGRIDVLELNDADRRKDENRISFMNALRTYWSYYYNIRSITLYDFENDRPLDADFDRLVM